MFGKEKCRILKEIRQKIADENEIPYVTQECHHQGNCSGTCPRCDAPVWPFPALPAARGSGFPEERPPEHRPLLSQPSRPRTIPKC